MSKPLKAYSGQDNYEGYGAVVFASGGAEARRKVASKLGCEWEDIASCRRSPEFDQYAPGPIQPMTLIEHGWWIECQHCLRRVSSEMAGELEVDGLNPDDFIPRPSAEGGVFCSEGCECSSHLERTGREEAADALREVFEARFPGAEIIHLHVAEGPKLTDDAGRFVVTFTFPGGQYGVSWGFGDEFCRVSQCDVEAWNAWRNLQPTIERN
ncbi:MAG: hypothetical protein LCH90_19285 [Proteobacteria bacterium]|nr:hypothetical protein [Pseudomonadota bacterium]